MKHHLRKERNCLNCGTEIPDRYCPHCGQENIEPKETVGYLISHFFSDITHYDSKFFITIRDLFFKPGFLTNEYLAGRRVRYLNPVRMYVFISAVFFIVMFTTGKEEKTSPGNEILQRSNTTRQHIADSLRAVLANQKVDLRNQTGDSVLRSIIAALDTPANPGQKEAMGFFLGEKGFLFSIVESRYHNLQEYDSIQRSLPETERDGWIGRMFLRKNISIGQRYGKTSEIIVSEDFQHNVPKLMFVLLPIFAALVQLFYHRNKSRYAGKIIFAIHFHSFVFLLFLIANLLDWLVPNKLFSFGLMIGLFIFTLSVMFVYLVAALRNVYLQTVWLTVFKAFAIAILYIVIIIFSLLIWALVLYFSA